ASARIVLYTLSLHDALPICETLRNGAPVSTGLGCSSCAKPATENNIKHPIENFFIIFIYLLFIYYLFISISLIFQSQWQNLYTRSEEHTSELQSRENLVCRL